MGEAEEMYVCILPSAYCLEVSTFITDWDMRDILHTQRWRFTRIERDTHRQIIMHYVYTLLVRNKYYGFKMCCL